MEDGLVQVIATYDSIHISSLNPYCNGRWSRTARSTASADITVVS